MNPEAITRKIAGLWPFDHHGRCSHCGNAGHIPMPKDDVKQAVAYVTRLDVHAPDCTWRAARQWVAAQP